MNYDPAHLRQAILGVATRPAGGMYTHPFGDPGPVPRTCQWPLWDDAERATHQYCGAATIPTRPYCANHCARAYGRSTEPRTPGLATSGSGQATRSITSAQAGAAPPPFVAPAIPAKPRHTKRAAIKAGVGPGVFARTQPDIDIRLCVNDREREFVRLFNKPVGMSHRAIGKKLGVSHNTVAGSLRRIRERSLEE
jgi:hypothetical protein